MRDTDTLKHLTQYSELETREPRQLDGSAFAIKHSAIHFAQPKSQFQSLARDTHQLFVAALAGRFKYRAKRFYFVFLSAQPLFEIVFWHIRYNLTSQSSGLRETSTCKQFNRFFVGQDSFGVTELYLSETDSERAMGIRLPNPSQPKAQVKVFSSHSR